MIFLQAPNQVHTIKSLITSSNKRFVIAVTLGKDSSIVICLDEEYMMGRSEKKSMMGIHGGVYTV